MSESVQCLGKALAQFQAEVRNPKATATNPHFRSKYAPLDGVLDEVRPILAKHGLSVIQEPSGDGKEIKIKTLILHESGEWLQLTPLVLHAEKATPQGAGSAITYGRRYALAALLGISADDDDDGNLAEPQKDKGKQSNKDKTGKAATPPVTPPKPEAAVDWTKFWGAMRGLGFTESNVYSIATIMETEKNSGEDVAPVKDISHYTQAQALALYDRMRSVREQLDKKKDKEVKGNE